MQNAPQKYFRKRFSSATVPSQTRSIPPEIWDFALFFTTMFQFLWTILSFCCGFVPFFLWIFMHLYSFRRSFCCNIAHRCRCGFPKIEDQKSLPHDGSRSRHVGRNDAVETRFRQDVSAAPPGRSCIYKVLRTRTGSAAGRPASIFLVFYRKNIDTSSAMC